MLAAIGMTLEDLQIRLLARHLQLMLQWNRKINLTSVRSTGGIVKRHFGESLFLAKALQGERGTVVDIGSGAGFPGFPIAVANPGLDVTLVESIGKKAAFLKEVARPVANAHVFHGRFEDLRERFNWAAVRGVATGKVLKQMEYKATNLALILGAEEARSLLTSGFPWESPLRVPWEPTRCVLLGIVPRET